jgi:hypothetical protein
MGLISRAVWSYGRGWARAINKYGKNKNTPILNEEMYFALQEKRQKKIQLKIERKMQKKFEKEERILDKARDILKSRNQTIPGLNEKIVDKNGKSRTTKLFRA